SSPIPPGPTGYSAARCVPARVTTEDGRHAMTATEPAGRWLQRLVQGQRRLLGLALVLALTSAVLFILQSWIIADLFGHWLQSASGAGQGAPGAGWWPILLLGLLLRPLLQFFREPLGPTPSWAVSCSSRWMHWMAISAAIRSSASWCFGCRCCCCWPPPGTACWQRRCYWSPPPWCLFSWCCWGTPRRRPASASSLPWGA